MNIFRTESIREKSGALVYDLLTLDEALDRLEPIFHDRETTKRSFEQHGFASSSRPGFGNFMVLGFDYKKTGIVPTWADLRKHAE